MKSNNYKVNEQLNNKLKEINKTIKVLAKEKEIIEREIALNIKEEELKQQYKLDNDGDKNLILNKKWLKEYLSILNGNDLKVFIQLKMGNSIEDVICSMNLPVDELTKILKKLENENLINGINIVDNPKKSKKKIDQDDSVYKIMNISPDIDHII